MADAGNIYAYDPDGCCMGLLKILNSEDIGQDVCYSIPDFNDREVEYICYTDKCGCSCCLPLEDEIIIHTTPGTIKTMQVGMSGSNVQFKRTEAFGTNWCKTVVRYRTDNTYPTSITDGTLLVEETTLNQYNSGYNKAISSFSGSCVHAKAFAVDNDGNILSQACGASILWTDKSFGLTCSEQSVLVPPGTYKLQVWGAQGGQHTEGGASGKGGYSEGCITLTTGTTFYVYVGGCGKNSSQYGTGILPGGYNGGGYSSGCPGEPGGSGGGGTDIRIGGNTIYHRRIVAGGGTGNSEDNEQGYAGGGCCGCGSYYGTQTGTSNGGAFFQAAHTSYEGGGAGGGWYGGGVVGGSQTIPTSKSTNDVSGAVGGGSGYTYNSSTCSSAPSGYCHCTAYFLTGAYSCPGTSSFPSPSGGTETGHSGNGCAKITRIN